MKREVLMGPSKLRLCFLRRGLFILLLAGLTVLDAAGQSREPYGENFDNGPGGWLANRYDPLPILDGIVYCYSPWYLDSHHAPPGAGYLHMLMYLYTSEKYVGADRRSHLVGNRFIEQNKSTDLTNARLTVRLRGDVDLQGSKLVLLIQGKTPKTMANFVLSGQPLRVDRDWTEQSIVLNPDPKQWTCLGARWDKVDQYGCDDIAVLLKDVNFDIMFVLFPLKVVPTHPELVKDMHRMRPGQDYPGYPSYEVEQKYLPRGVIMFDSVRIDYPAAAAEANPASDATLRALSASQGKLSPGFSGPRQAYTVFVPQSCQNVRITAAASDPLAAIRVNGAQIADGGESPPVPVSVGRTFVDVDVTSADGKSQDNYRIKVIRPYPTPNWVRVKENNPWVPRDSAGELVYNGRMWLFGGYTPGLVSDVWSSADGVEWSKSGEVPSPAGVNIPINFVYDGKMWVATQDGAFYSSSDGASWTLAAPEIPWKGQYASGGTVFAGKMWVISRRKGTEPGNDIWSSTDGAHWTQEMSGTPFSKRQLFSDVAAFKDRLWVVGGGGAGYHPFRAYNDVWSSADGRNWTKATDRAPFPVRIWNSSAVYKNRLWFLGGFRAEPTWNNFNDVWYSADGADWNPLVTEDVWSPRHEFSLYLFDDKLWMVGGNAWPLQNDVWYLEIKGLTFLTQPAIEEVAGNEYTYRARADFNASGEKPTYRLIEAPPWLSVDPATGLIRGTPVEPGDFKVIVEAADTAGETARQAYTLHILKE
jgi:Cadherin-like beta sandwich domain/Putative Ig domain